MDATRIRTTGRRVSLSLLGLFLIIVTVFGCWLWLLIVDRLPYFLRTSAAQIGLNEYEADLLEELNAARSQFATEGFYEGDDESVYDAEAFSRACLACQRANLALWRIKLAGSKHALRFLPPSPRPTPSV